ncbi:MAG: LPXTG cell wall anchor domain-containing protein [Clostridia bacterium]|nr:LPXTG cell wall anchor domain-containing protein [Clostridia bacterium]
MIRKKLIIMLALTIALSCLAATALSATIHRKETRVDSIDDLEDGDYIEGGTVIYNDSYLAITYYVDVSVNGSDEQRVHRYTTYTVPGSGWYDVTRSQPVDYPSPEFLFTLNTHTNHINETGDDCLCDICGGSTHNLSGNCKCQKCGKYFHTLGYNMFFDFCWCERCEKPIHNIVHYPEKAPTCTETGMPEYWYCERCHKYYLDTNYDSPFSGRPSAPAALPATKHANKTHHERSEPTCTENGNIEYWYCSDCENLYSDAGMTEQIEQESNVILPATNHASKTHHERSEPTCTTDGNIEYWHCKDCGKLCADAAMTVPIESEADIILASPGHSITIHHPKGEPTCTADGSEEFWSCSVCLAQFIDQAGSAVYVPGNPAGALGHDWADAYTVSETQHWLDCSRSCGDTNQLGDHTFIEVIDKEPTYTEEGLKREVCSVCGYERSRSSIAVLIMPELPATGDHSQPALWLGAALISTLVLIGVRKEKHC